MWCVGTKLGGAGRKWGEGGGREGQDLLVRFAQFVLRRRYVHNSARFHQVPQEPLSKAAVFGQVITDSSLPMEWERQGYSAVLLRLWEQKPTTRWQNGKTNATTSPTNHSQNPKSIVRNSCENWNKKTKNKMHQNTNSKDLGSSVPSSESPVCFSVCGLVFCV